MCCSVYLLSYILDHVIAASQGIVHQKLNIMAVKMYSSSQLEQIWINLGLHHLLSQWVPSE